MNQGAFDEEERTQLKNVVPTSLCNVLIVESVPVRDHAQFKNKPINCNSIKWFIFNLHRKTKQLETVVQMFRM